MRIKKEPLVLAAIILALVLYLLYRDSDRAFYQLPRFEKVAASDISKIDVTRSGKTITLERQADGTWQIMPQEYRVESTRTDRMVNTLSGLTLTALVSESEAYTRYGLDEAEKVTVKAWTGDLPVRRLEIGKAITGLTFVRLPGDKRIFHAGESFRWHFDLDMDDLRDKTVMTLKPDEIVEIEIQKDDQSLKIVRNTPAREMDTTQQEEKDTPHPQEPVWIGPEGKMVVESSIDYLLKTFSNLKCERYVEGKEKGDFVEPIYSITMKGPEDLYIKVMEKEEGKDGNEEEYVVISSQNRFPFYLSKWEATKIMAPLEDLIKTEPSSVEKKEDSQPEK